MNVTREMINAAHDVTMKAGVVLSWETLRDIYLSMDVLANHEKTADSLPKLDEEMDYERGFVDGMQYQMESSVDKAVNAMARKWAGLTDEEVSQIIDDVIGFNSCWGPEEKFARAIEAALKEKNT